MDQSEPDRVRLPIWARDDSFPLKPEDSQMGYISKGDIYNPVTSREELVQAVIGKTKRSALLVWTEESDYCVTPEEVEWLQSAVLKASREMTEEEFSSTRQTSLIFGAMFVWAVYSAYHNSGGNLSLVLRNQTIAVTGLFLTMFGLLPFYNAWKARRAFSRMKESDVASIVPEARFDIWLADQKTPVTRILMAVMVAAGVVQTIAYFKTGSIGPTIEAAALVKSKVVAGEWWRYLTAPLMHGDPIHWLFNASALWFLGRRTEILARWPHVPAILVLAGAAGGVLSVLMRNVYPQPSVGASGAIVGLLGFLLVFEFTHGVLVPRSARRRLVAAVSGLIVIGLVGVQLIDNAAHAGGLIAGMAYSFLIFPKSKSPERPKATAGDKMWAIGSGVIILNAFLITAMRLLTL